MDTVAETSRADRQRIYRPMEQGGKTDKRGKCSLCGATASLAIENGYIDHFKGCGTERVKK